MGAVNDINVFDVTQIEPVAERPGGTRAGYIGALNDRLYMVKFELQGYNTNSIGYSTEFPAVESFTAQLIRSIWGKDYAADIQVGILPENVSVINRNDLAVNVDNAQAANLTLLEDDFRIELEDYDNQTVCVVSSFENNSTTFERWLISNNENVSWPQMDRLAELQTIAKILGIDDYKFANMLIDLNNEDTIKLIDCGGTYHLNEDFNPETLFNSSYQKVDLTSFNTDMVYNIVDRFLSYTPEQLDLLLKQYSEVLSENTQDEIRQSFANLRYRIQHAFGHTLGDTDEPVMTTPATSTAYVMASMGSSGMPTHDLDFNENSISANQTTQASHQDKVLSSSTVKELAVEEMEARRLKKTR